MEEVWWCADWGHATATEQADRRGNEVPHRVIARKLIFFWCGRWLARHDSWREQVFGRDREFSRWLKAYSLSLYIGPECVAEEAFNQATNTGEVFLGEDAKCVNLDVVFCCYCCCYWFSGGKMLCSCHKFLGPIYCILSHSWITLQSARDSEWYWLPSGFDMKPSLVCYVHDAIVVHALTSK